MEDLRETARALVRKLGGEREDELAVVALLDEARRRGIALVHSAVHSLPGIEHELVDDAIGRQVEYAREREG